MCNIDQRNMENPIPSCGRTEMMDPKLLSTSDGKISIRNHENAQMPNMRFGIHISHMRKDSPSF